jgi:phosphoglycolate phosphatase-like HAD superfamily hydrolase
MTAALKVLLFDVDHTLLAAGGAGFRAMDRAFVELYGVESATRGITPDGKTDPMLFGEALVRCRLAAAGSPPPPELVRRYETLFPEEMAAPPAELMPGVRELLHALSGHPQVLLGLLTGNLERTARLKVATFGLDHHFAFGAYGSDHGDRLRLPPIAVERAERLAGRTIGLGRHVVIVGDTPRDVVCAHAWGATAVGVATGRSSTRQLLDAGAHLVFEDLSDSLGFIEALRLEHGEGEKERR